MVRTGQYIKRIEAFTNLGESLNNERPTFGVLVTNQDRVHVLDSHL